MHDGNLIYAQKLLALGRTWLGISVDKSCRVHVHAGILGLNQVKQPAFE